MHRIRRDNYATLDALVAHARTQAHTHANTHDRARLDVNERACVHEGRAASHRPGVKIAVAICTHSGGVAPFMRACISMIRVRGTAKSEIALKSFSLST